MTYALKAQLKCAGMLSGFIKRGEDALLPPLVWTIGFDGMTGKLDDFTGSGHARSLFAGWVKVIGASPKPERQVSDGVELTASLRYPDAVVVLRCKIPS